MLESLRKILEFAIKHWFRMLLTAAGAAIGAWILWLYKTYVKDWLLSIRYIEMPGWAWVLLCVVVFLLVVYFVRGIMEKVGQLKNPGDVISAIRHWFTGDISDRPQMNTPYYFATVEKDLNLKRGSSKIYLPLVALKHGYVFQMGKKTFTLTKLTSQNDPFTIFEQHLKPLDTGEKEVLLSCDNIDGELAWPKGAAKLLLLSMPLRNVNFEIDIKDMGGGRIRIARKE